MILSRTVHRHSYTSNPIGLCSIPIRTLKTKEEIQARVDSLMEGDRSALARTITLVESSNMSHRSAADEVMK